MNELVLPVDAGTLPQGACPTNYQSLLDLFAQFMSVTFPSSFTGVIVSAAQPTDTSRAWVQLDSNGRFIRLYTFAQGHWLAPHPLVSGFIMIWPFALPDFTTFDGGNSNPAGPQSGPMWQQAADSAGNLIMAPGFPLGAGALASGAVINPGSVGGEESHSLTTPEMPPHTHEMSQFGKASATGNTTGVAQGLVSYGVGAVGPITTLPDSAGGTGATPVVTPHNNMPPYYGVYFLQRTSRLFYSV